MFTYHQDHHLTNIVKRKRPKLTDTIQQTYYNSKNIENVQKELFAFIIHLFSLECASIFIREMSSWEDLWEFIESQNPNPREKIYYFDNIIQHSLSSNIPALFRDNTDYLEVNYDKAYIKDQTRTNFIAKTLNLKFLLKGHNPIRKDTNYNYIYHNNHYRIHPDTIHTILKYLGEPQEVFEGFYQTKPLTVIISRFSYDEPLVLYVKNNFSEFVQAFYLDEERIKTQYRESPEAMIEILSHPDLSDENKENFLKRNSTKLTHTDLYTLRDSIKGEVQVIKTLLQMLIEKDKLEVSDKMLFAIRSLSSNNLAVSVNQSLTEDLSSLFIDQNLDFFKRHTINLTDLKNEMNTHNGMDNFKLIEKYLFSSKYSINDKLDLLYTQRNLLTKDQLSKILNHLVDQYSDNSDSYINNRSIKQTNMYKKFNKLLKEKKK